MIEAFEGKYRFLSNFYMASTIYEGLEYPSAEHAYQASKSLNLAERKYIQKLETARKAKRAGRKVKLRPDWEAIKLDVMSAIVKSKFTRHPHLKSMLLKTGNAEIQEGNLWGDSFWGVDLETKHGQNHLGKILMNLRKQFKENKN